MGLILPHAVRFVVGPNHHRVLPVVALVVLDHGHVVASGTTSEVLTPALLTEVFGVRADIDTHPTTGRPLLMIHPPTPIAVGQHERAGVK